MPQSWNRYTYTLGNPVKYVDPDGNLAFLAAAWAAVEFGMSAFDAYETTKIAIDPSASVKEKLSAGGLFVAGVIGPGVYGPIVRRLGKVAISSAHHGRSLSGIVNRLDKVFSEGLNAEHAVAAGREAAGEVVKLKSSGLPFDHFREFNEARTGATNQIDNLKGLLKDPGLPDAERAFAEFLLRKASKDLDEAERLFEKSRQAAGATK